jgi:5-carboxymethyl-2-hydroxymuconate isomerase
MPHITLEYSSSLKDSRDIPAVLSSLHETLSDQGIDIARIKTRGIALDDAVVGDQGSVGQMMHATLLLLAGRDIPTKKQYGDALHNVMKDAAPEGCAVTLEIRDMDPDSYYL